MTPTPSAFPLVAPRELDRELATGPDPRRVLLDLRWRLGGPPGWVDYRAGHLPGAVFLDLDVDLAAPPGRGGRHPLPDPSALQAALRTAGIGDDSRIVCYDSGNGVAAARAWWVLRWAGLGDVRVLDGGFAAWTGPVVTAIPTPEPGEVTVRPGGMPVLGADGAAALARDGVLLDARAPARYRGETEPVDAVAGHIPEAVNAPVEDNLDAEGRMPDADRIRQRFAALGVTDGVPVGAYCGSGVAAAHTVLTLAAAGVPAALYVGSWSDWVTDPARPVATA